MSRMILTPREIAIMRQALITEDKDAFKDLIEFLKQDKMLVIATAKLTVDR